MLLFILFSDSWNLFCSKLTEWYSCSACQMVLLTRTTGSVPLVWCPTGSDHWECTICLMSYSPGPLGMYCLSDVLLTWTTGSVLFVWCARGDMGCIVASGDLNTRFWFQLSPFFSLKGLQGTLGCVVWQHPLDFPATIPTVYVLVSACGTNPHS